jgi:hypothetical protein
MHSLECHFIMRGPEDSPYAGGEYHGVLLFPPQYPFAPPGIKVFTPSGRFIVRLLSLGDASRRCSHPLVVYSQIAGYVPHSAISTLAAGTQPGP